MQPVPWWRWSLWPTISKETLRNPLEIFLLCFWVFFVWFCWIFLCGMETMLIIARRGEGDTCHAVSRNSWRMRAEQRSTKSAPSVVTELGWIFVARVYFWSPVPLYRCLCKALLECDSMWRTFCCLMVSLRADSSLRPFTVTTVPPLRAPHPTAFDLHWSSSSSTLLLGCLWWEKYEMRD